MQVNKKKSGLILLTFIALLLFVLPFQTVRAQTATISVSPPNNLVTVGQTITVNIEISGVQNLYAVDIAMTWDTSMLKLDSNQSFVGVSSGILNAPVLEVQDTASQQTGEYNLVATSENPAVGWSGSGIVATLTFTVTSAGQSALTLESSSSNAPVLANYPQPGTGETSTPISATVVNGSVYTASASSPSASPTASTSPAASPSSSPNVPEFPVLAILPLLILVSLGLLMLKLRKQTFGKASSTRCSD